ncbi:hypothetical protein [Leptolyngbya sp. FACHB-711]|uniref:hypothetical protein n=1 Tax=Leptolyngbya sp. FACHB-711 TaxID=2692813 RepID=UPI0016830376|nr:hypothetical protein [Leptolyngbya sp. FACHB-711]MBD2023807.1 hypothetical protein [Leptolyngbya sp. FACHB-711]
MPVDKNAVLNGNGKAQQSEQVQPTPDEATALAALTQTAAGTIRQSIGAMTQLAEKLEDQRDLVTDHAADRVAAILDPQSIQAEIAVKTLSRLEGKSFVPFELEAIELPEVRQYVPQLPQSYAVAVLPTCSNGNGSSPIGATGSETTSNGKPRTEAGKGFGLPRNDS